MTGLEPVFNRILWGAAFGCLFFLLYRNIDRCKGLLVELAAVSLPILLAAALILFATFLGWREVACKLASFVPIVFQAVPLLVAARLIVRIRAGERIGSSDLFRVTTASAMGIYGFTSFTNGYRPELLGLLVGTYLLGEWAANASAGQTTGSLARLERYDGRSSKVLRSWAVAWTITWLIWLFSSRWSRFAAYSETSPDSWLLLPPDRTPGFLDETLAPLACGFSLLLLPWWLDRWLVRSPRLHRMSWRLAAWYFSFGKPEHQIHSRTIVRLWHFPAGICFLNHGSFGAVPLLIRDWQREIRSRCEDQPMDFLARRLESHWLDARFWLATWLGTRPENLAFCENATSAMNELASWFPLAPGDEVLLNDHEYGAVRRIWERRCHVSQAGLKTATLPLPVRDQASIIRTIVDSCSEKTKLVVLSHITSPSAIRMPVEQISAELRKRGIAICVDGPHALLQESLNLSRLSCDFYTASCHKWLCGPVGSGFIYVHPKWHSQIQPARLSWGRLPPKERVLWSDELLWTGTRDYSPYLTIPDTIRFFQAFNVSRLDLRNHALASYARRKLCQIPGMQALTPEGREWYGWMVATRLPPSDSANYDDLQQRLLERHGIEVPIVPFGEGHLVRVSCHLHTSTRDIDFLCRALRLELG